MSGMTFNFFVGTILREFDYATQKPSVAYRAHRQKRRHLSAASSSTASALRYEPVAVAERLNRRWIACDLGRFAIHTTRKRLLDIPRGEAVCRSEPR